jgi:arylamine N-acetyltransferase
VPRDLSRASEVFLELYGLRPSRADLATLGKVSERYASLPWENLTKFLAKHGATEDRSGAVPERIRDVPGAGKLRLSAEVLDDHARQGAGGTCFSLTNALRRIVTDLGYTAYPVMADMRHGPDVHCGLVVDLGGRRFLLDPGYLVPEPIPLREGETVRVALPARSLEYRPVPGTHDYEMHTVNDRGEEMLRYRLRPRPVPDDEFVRHWIDSFDTTGMNGLHLNRVSGGERLSAHDLNLRIDTGRAKTNVNLRDRYAETVSDRFGLDRDLVRAAHDAWIQERCRTR